ncbi:hypothetical protein RB595_010470 [Gaeumannomyces hyphopodioides]
MDPFTFASAGVKLAVQTAFFTVELTQAPDQIRRCLRLTRTCKDYLDRLIKARDEHRAALSREELCEPDGNSFEMGLRERVQWKLLNSKDFIQIIPTITSRNSNVDNEITHIIFKSALVSTNRLVSPPAVGTGVRERDDEADGFFPHGDSTLNVQVASPTTSSPQPTPLCRDDGTAPRKRGHSWAEAKSRLHFPQMLRKKSAASLVRSSVPSRPRLSQTSVCSSSSTGSSSITSPQGMTGSFLGDSLPRSQRENIMLLDDEDDEAVPIVVPISRVKDGNGAEDTANAAPPPQVSGRLFGLCLPGSQRGNIVSLDPESESAISLPLPTIPPNAPASRTSLDFPILPPVVPIPPLTFILRGHGTDALLP